MKNPIEIISIFLYIYLGISAGISTAQTVPILDYNIDANGQVVLKIQSRSDRYYVLKIRHNTASAFEIPVSMTPGTQGELIISEQLGHYPAEHYQVLEYSIQTPFDTDGDGIDDMTEYLNIPRQSPFNSAGPVAHDNGLAVIDNFATFKKMSIKKDQVKWSEFLNGKGYVKYIITDFYAQSPIIYFIKSESFDLHEDFARAVGIPFAGDDVKKGQVIFHPSSISNNGTLGTFAFNYSNGHGQSFEVVQRTHELLASNMTFLKNNLSYFITERNEEQYFKDELLFQNSRVPVLFEADVYAEVDYWGLHPAEGFGFFRVMGLEEVPGARDIVLYEGLPNALPRVGGIITSVIQTPLSHVNLRAIQNNIPNAFIREPLEIDSIADLVDHYIYFKVEQDKYFIREATLQEVNDWFESIRPVEEQHPALNLEYKDILPLSEISFSMSDAFGAKCANMATMHTFGFPEGVIPDGYGIPFYYYVEFMKHNDLYREAEQMMANPAFQSDRNVRDDKLKDFRKKIKDASMPSWMLNNLTTLQQSFPPGTPIRCRSSTNNEDLPNFNGAGLYDSKTQHPGEGHISKSIKQVYSSLWNLRAFEERDFYRVNHMLAAMGVLCHPNFSDEKVNGVGVSTDPLYNTDNTFYLNSQLGEELITNPVNSALPEEILLDRYSQSNNDYIIIQRSSLAPDDSLLMQEPFLDEMRTYLSVIHDQFKVLYNAQDDEDFAMDIEYKITSSNKLSIKQARPWVTSSPPLDPVQADSNKVDFKIFPNPSSDRITVQCDDCGLRSLSILDINGKVLLQQAISEASAGLTDLIIKDLLPGVYIVCGYLENNSLHRSGKFLKR